MKNKATLALTAKAKALFGERLKPADYDQLLQRKNIAEIAGYLKENTYFKEVLVDINEKNVHRGQLESLIRMDAFNRFAKLLRYADSNSSDFHRYGIIENEIFQILACIRSISSHDKLPMIAKMPTYIQHLMSFDMAKLAGVTTYVDLLEVLKGTPYVAILKPFETGNMEDFDYAGCESALMNYYFTTVLAMADKNFKGKTRQEIREVVLTEIELDNITKIYRMKKYFDLPSEKIKTMLTPIYLRIPKKTLENLIDTCDADHFYEELSKTAYRNYMDSSHFVYIEYHTESINYNLNRRNLAFSSEPDLVLLSYMTLAETEIKNVVDIIEGVRYNIAPEKIRRLLIY